MGRCKLYKPYELPRSVVTIVEAICGDYNRRERLLSNTEECSDELDMCRELNRAVDVALIDLEEGLRSILLGDVACHRGYIKSEACELISKDAYYRRRRKFIHDIAVNLGIL